MPLDTTQYQKFEESIAKTRTKQVSDINSQIRESLESYRERAGRVRFLAHRIEELEHKLDIRGQQVESLHTTFNTAMFKGDDQAMTEAKAHRVEVAAEMETLENELVGLKHEYEASDFDKVREGQELLEDVRQAKSLIAGDVRAKCLADDIESAFTGIDQDVRDAKLAAVKARRAS